MGIHKEYKTGDIVKSVSGRDKNRYYVVMSAEEKNVKICDGDLHKLDKLKRKNIKHIRYAGETDEVFKQKLSVSGGLCDKEIRRMLAKII